MPFDADADARSSFHSSHGRATRVRALVAATSTGVLTAVPRGLIVALGVLMAGGCAERSSGVGEQLQALLCEPAVVADAVVRKVDPEAATAAAVGLTWPAPTFIDRLFFNPHTQFVQEPVAHLARMIRGSGTTRRQLRRLEGAVFTFDTPEAIAVAAGDLSAILSHVLRLSPELLDLRRLRALISRPLHATSGGGDDFGARALGVHGWCGEDVLRVLDAHPQLHECGYPLLDPCHIVVAAGSEGAKALEAQRHPTMEDELAFRVVLANILVAAALADRVDAILAVAHVVPLHALCDILLTCAGPTRESLKVGYAPANFYAACDVSLLGARSSFSPMHFVAASGSATVTSACFAIIAAADSHTPHLTPRDAAHGKLRELPFCNESARRVQAQEAAAHNIRHFSSIKLCAPQLALHRVLTMGTNIRTTPLQVAAAANNSAFLEGLLSLGVAFGRRDDVNELYAKATVAGLMEEVTAEAAGAGMVDLFNTVTGDSLSTACTVTAQVLSRAADLAITEQRIGTLFAVCQRGGMPSEPCVRVTPSSILVQAHKAGAALPDSALQRIRDAV